MAGEKISDVVAELWALAARAAQAGSRMGFFAALYARVTSAMAAHVERGFFDDGPRMGRLDVKFARLYIEAAERRIAGAGGVGLAWTVAFDACEEREPMVLQHLYLGMNAHLLVDLPIAVAEVSSRSTLASLRRDFRRINEVVEAEMGAFHEDLCAISPRLARFYRSNGRLWSAGSNATLFVARELAWHRAGCLVRADAHGRARLVEALDHGAARLGREVIRHPPVGAGLVRAIRAEESDDTRRVVRALMGGRAPAPTAGCVLKRGQST
jgi:hypothetical protein